MANRTFKVYGQAYAESGDVTAVLTVGGTEVFNGAVNDSTTVRSGPPDTTNHLFSFTLDENTTGNLSYSLNVSGGELCLGPTEYNGVKSQIIADDNEFFSITGAGTLEQQQTYSAQIGESNLGTALYNKMQAGTATADDADAILAANKNGARNFGTAEADFVTADDTRTSAQVDGEALPDWNNAEVNTKNWVIIEDGSTFTCTWSFDPDTYI